MEDFADRKTILPESSLKSLNEPDFLWSILESSIQGILILRDIDHLIYANQHARRILRKMDQAFSQNNVLPEEINYIFKSLQEIRHLFPKQDWLIETKILTEQSISFEIQARWAHVRATNSRCLLLMLKDADQQRQDIALEEATRYNLTCRETDVWLLYKVGYAYKEIAAELDITANTVKKHMKNIWAKQQSQ
ncbi:MAG: LuxR C-terminal-related transcriptional regulator [Cyanobacteria bacterium P01_B01_bin.77]